MASRKSVATLFVMLMISAGLSGCFGEESKEVQRGIPGGLTLACLSDDKYTSMVVEIDYEAGYMPEQSSTDLLKTRLEQVCDKPQGIEVFLTETNFDHEGQWSASDVREKGWNEKSNNPQSDSTLYWQAIFPSGQYANDGVLGVAVDASTIAIFGEAVDDAEGPIFNRPSAEEIENSVLVHEFGHLLGLVNLVYQSPVEHEDEEHKGHSNNEDSVMYWAIESANIGNIITGELPDDFDDDDLNDLAGMLSGEIESNNQLWTN
jgi:predicted Zn-dependent protease with MMP-like domain